MNIFKKYYSSAQLKILCNHDGHLKYTVQPKALRTFLTDN